MILVTGAAGFIGSSLIEELNQCGRKDIIAVDRLGESDKWKNLRPLHYAEYIHADDLFTPDCGRALKKVESIFHMGACSSTTERNVDFLMQNNVEYSKKIWRAAVRAEAKLIYASSAATYGDGGLGYNDSHQGIKNLRPLNPYGYSKHLFDLWALGQAECPPVWCGFKFFNVYGANEYYKGEMRSLVHQAFEQICARGTVKLFKSHRNDCRDGEQKRDFIYVKDAVQAMLNLDQLIPSGTQKNINGIYNMGTGKARTFYDLANNIFQAMQRPPRIEFIDMPLHLRGQYQYFTQAPMQKYRELCPQHTFFSLEEGVRDCVQNYLMATI